MKSSLRADLLALSFIIFIIIATFGLSNAEFDRTKNRRGAGGGASGLFAFPRVGRNDASFPDGLHDVRPNDFYAAAYDDVNELSRDGGKFESIMNFAPVAQNGAETRKWIQLLTQRPAFNGHAGPSATSGLWFGPRLGKRSLSSQPY